ncbi:MAG: PEGA domain-containing protein, partial [Methanolinea sp.]|nr:PEGA domain-containing protein [Methanolinea sp.]
PGGTITVQAYLQPAQNTGSVYVTSVPTGGTATLDTGDRQSTPCSFPVVPAGTHSLTVFLSGYQPYYASLKVDSGQTTTINAALTPVAKRGNLAVYSSPAGASVYADGNYYGTTPATVGNLAAGTHTVSLRLAGYTEYSTTVSVSAGSTTTLNPTLTSSPSYGSISVTSNPAGAGVYLDGTYQGRIGLGQPFNIVSILPGTHVILLSLPGYQDYSATITVNPGVITPVYVKFVAAPAQTDGNINIVSSPSSAEVYLDNVYQGYTPFTVHNVAAGTHTVLMRLSGYNDWQTTVQVTAGQTVPVTATFTAAPPTPTKSGAFPAALLIGLGAIAILAWKGRD